MKRVLLKLSGEALAGDKKTGFDDETILSVASQVKQLVDDNINVGIVIGGEISGEDVQAKILIEPRLIRSVCLLQ